MSIGSVTGIASAVCFAPLVVKYPVKRLKLDKANACLMKMHEGASAGFLLLGTAHMIAELCTKKGGVLLKYSGLFALIMSLWLITDCHIAKDGAKKMDRHRWYSLFLTASICCHALSA